MAVYSDSSTAGHLEQKQAVNSVAWMAALTAAEKVVKKVACWADLWVDGLAGWRVEWKGFVRADWRAGRWAVWTVEQWAVCLVGDWAEKKVV